MRHFINPDFGAPNVFTVPVDPAIPREFAGLSQDLAPAGFVRIRPKWNSDIVWISAETEETFGTFDRAFQRLGIAERVRPYLDIEGTVQLYAGFLVARSACDAPNFHPDWEKTNNEAFTFMTPVSDNAQGFGLLYWKLDGSTGEYDYRPGEGIVFGDHFIHSTKPGRSDEPVVLLCFTCGTDKMEHWDKIVRTAGTQSRLIRRPDGQMQRLDQSAGYPAP